MERDNLGFGEEIYRLLFQAQIGALCNILEDGRVCRELLEVFPPEKVLGNQARLQSVITAPSVVRKGSRTAGSRRRGFLNLPADRRRRWLFKRPAWKAQLEMLRSRS